METRSHPQRTRRDRSLWWTEAGEASRGLWPRSQHGDLGHVFERAESMIDQPADVRQASQRPPSTDQVTIDVGVVGSNDIAEVLRMPERESRKIEQRITLGCLRPVDDASDLVAGDEDVVDVEVPVDEHWCPRPHGGAGSDPRGRRCGRWLPEATERYSWKSHERQHRRLPPQNFRCRNRRHRHGLHLGISASLISVNFQEHITDPQRRSLTMGDHDLNTHHVAIIAEVSRLVRTHNGLAAPVTLAAQIPTRPPMPVV